MQKTLVHHVQPTLNGCLSTFTFDLRMSKGAPDVFNVVVSNNWEPKHVYSELFESIDTFGVAMVVRL